MTKLLVASIFKNESHIMEEWIAHYINQGVDCFILIDNGSTDNPRKILDRYIDDHIVFYINDPTKHDQIGKYNRYILPIVKQLQDTWVIVVDLDEFLYAKRPATLETYLGGIGPDIKQISVPWKMFGSSGHVSQPTSVIDNFCKRQIYSLPALVNLKSIIRSCALQAFGIHEHSMLSYHSATHVDAAGRCMTDPIVRPYINEPLISIDENILRASTLQLNHYPIQSWEWFKNVKMIRGSANCRQHDHVRNADYFKRYDTNDIMDSELRSIRKGETQTT